MKEQMGKNPQSQRSLPHRSDRPSQIPKSAHAGLFSGFGRFFALIAMLTIILAGVLIVHPFSSTRSAHAAGAVGFHISGRNLLDVNGNNFIIRGISHPYTWFLNQDSSFANIKAAGANTVRVVLSGGQNGGTATSYSNVQTAVNLCKSNKLVCVVEDHDTTGYEGSGGGSLANAVNYWKSLQGILTGQEDWVIINIGNEAWGNTNTSGWVSATKNAITSMRNAGFKNTLMVDAPDWGQDSDDTMLYNASSIESVDSMHNTIFSVHMYGVYQSKSSVDSYLTNFHNTGLPLVIGEFGSTESGNSQSDDADEIMAEAQYYGIGYMGWSWSGNDSSNAYLDMVENFNPGDRSSWGNRIITGSNGLQQTSHECSCYGSSGGGGGGGFTPTSGKWYRIVNRNSGQVLDVTNQATGNGGLIEQWANNGGHNQDWTFEATNGGYKIVNVNSGLLLDDPGYSASEGTQLDQWNDTSGTNQWWNIVSAGSGYYHIVNQSSGYYVDVQSGSTTEGAEVIQWPGDGGNNQEWEFVGV